MTEKHVPIVLVGPINRLAAVLNERVEVDIHQSPLMTGVFNVRLSTSTSSVYYEHKGSVDEIAESIHQLVDVIRGGQPAADKWAKRLMETATHVSLWSKDTTKVGAVLTDATGKVVLLTAFNGPAMGVEDHDWRFDRTNGVKYLWAEHAEQNLISFAARRGIATDGLTVVCTHHPCSRCAGIMVQAGIRRVIVGPGTTSMPDAEFEAAAQKFKEAGIELVQITDG